MAKLLGDIPLALVVEDVLRVHKSKKEFIDWNMLVERLEVLVRISGELMEAKAIVALWAAVIIAEEAIEKANAN